MPPRQQTSRLTLALLAALTSHALAIDAVINFSELMYHPREGEAEWVELHNMMTVDVDLSEWSLTGGIEYTFPVGTRIRGGGYLVIQGGDHEANFQGNLNNNGERIRLLNNSGRLMDEIDWGDSGRWPVAADGSGASLAKKGPRLGSELPESWTFSEAIGGSPRLANPTTRSSQRVRIDEVSASTATNFFVELVNASSAQASTNGMVLENPSAVLGGRYPLPNRTLQPGERMVINEATLDFRVADEGRLFLFGTNNRVTDAVRVKNRPLARREGATPDDRFLTPSRSTPGERNVFSINEDIVINEIMYHHRPQMARTAQESEIALVELSPFSAPWRFNQSGQDQGADWAQHEHPIGGSWVQGRGVLGFDLGGSLPEPILTPLTWPALNDPFIITYYFEREIHLTQEQVDHLVDVQLRHLIDDGAVIYVNGQEVARHCLAAGAVTADTLANCPASNDAELSALLTIAKDKFRAGSNRISVEVHQAEIGNSDVVFGLELNARISEGRPAQDYADNPEEWIELYNRGVDPVTLDGWSLDGTIAFDFPANTTISPGDYVIVAEDQEALAAKYPNLRILGQFRGRLNNDHGYLRLEDPVQNPVDEVHYYDGGRWPGDADGEGSSLELRDPHADNSVAEAWSASDETGRSTWQEFTFTSSGRPFTGTNDPSNYHEFIMGLLDSGEFLIDDIRVRENSSRELIQNGTFESDPVGRAPARWRMLGTHGLHGRSIVINNPDGPGKVLHVVATGPMWHTQNQAETTLKFRNSFVTISSNQQYEISFRAKWLRGNPLLNTRLYFNRVAKTHLLSQPEISGTPGAPNSTLVENLGPTIEGFHHSPARPSSNRAVTVEAHITDPNGVAQATLHWSINGTTFTPVAMTKVEGSLYRGQIPGRFNNTRVQFYVEARDQNGATSTFPAEGRDSRAMYRVGTEAGSTNRSQHIEIIMLATDESILSTNTNLMCNHRFLATVVYEDEVFYNVGVRLKSSQRGRPSTSRRGFSISFNPDQKFRGALNSIGLDRSGGWKFGRQYGQDEILIWHYLNRAGDIPAQHNDIIFVDGPGVPDGTAQLQLARFSNEFLDSQWEKGGDGSMHNYELIYYPTTTTGGPEGLKRPNPDSVNGVPVVSMGANKEPYRYYFQLRNNQWRDDYSGMIALGNLFRLSSSAMNRRADSVIDVDQWLRTFAGVSLGAISDSYFNNTNGHNTRFYHRPSDGRMLLFPWDMDFAFVQGTSSSLTPNSDLRKLLSHQPFKRIYWGHMLDLIDRSYNSNYMNFWVQHYRGFLTNQSDISTLSSFIQQRSTYARSQIRSQVRPVAFSITSNGGNDFDSSNPAVVRGNGWVNVREIRLQGSQAPLSVIWNDQDSWQIALPLQSAGANQFTLEAVDHKGAVIATDTITITNTTPVLAASVDNLRITELMYHPAPPSEQEGLDWDQDQFEFCEFQNVGDNPINLGGVSFAEGIEFTFPDNTLLDPGERIVIASDPSAFAVRYGAETVLAGHYRDSGSFRNSGERVHLLAADGSTISNFSYRDSRPWPISADGDGFSLIAIAPDHPDFDPTLAHNWRTSQTLHGNPGGGDTITFPDWSAAQGNVAPLDDPDADNIAAIIEYANNGSAQSVDGSPAIFVDSDSLHRFSVVLAIGPDDVVYQAEVSDDLITWRTENILYDGSRNNGDGTRTLRFEQTQAPLGQFVRLRYARR